MLVDWLVEVVDEFQLSQETLFLAVALLDRFLSLKPVLCCQLQLLGVTCLWVAAKFEEVLPPCLQVGLAVGVACACLRRSACGCLSAHNPRRPFLACLLARSPRSPFFKPLYTSNMLRVLLLLSVSSIPSLSITVLR
jgi:hypothetical protein